MSDEVFQRYSAYYDLLYRDKDYAAEAEYIGRTLRAAAPKASRVLEFGSGTGRHGRLLAAQGFHVHGVERSAAMVAAAAKEKATGPGSFDCQQGDIATVNAGGPCDAVISLFHVVSYVNSNDLVRATFGNAARHLSPGGVFFFDVWHGPAVLSDRPAVRVKRVEDKTTKLIRVAEPTLDVQTSRVTVHYTMLAQSKADGAMTTFTEEHQMRYFFPTEIALFAELAGFDVERSEEFLTARAPSDRTWGVAYLLRKRA